MALVAAFAAPTLASKTVIGDEELDEVTAAGQPKIAQASTYDGTAAAVNFQVNVFATHVEGQSELTALTLNNIFGENQIANGVNIQSGNANSGSQSNNASQSWGSAKAWDSVKVKGQKGGDASNSHCVGLIVKCNASGGDASQGQIGLLWEFADEIADAHTGHGDAIAANVVVTIVAAAFGENSQTNLTALTVNNVFGFNQVANGLNISSGTLSADGIAGGTTGSATSQSNISDQWRGTPKNYWLAPTFSTTP